MKRVAVLLMATLLAVFPIVFEDLDSAITSPHVDLLCLQDPTWPPVPPPPPPPPPPGRQLV
jgi:hypothetical protein